MVAKLVLGLLAVAFVLSVAVIAAYLYLRDTAKMRHEKEMQRLERELEQEKDK